MNNKLADITVVVESGRKYVTPQGTTAIKDGMSNTHNRELPSQKKPAWLSLKLVNSPKYDEVKNLVKKNSLSTVCEEAKCPNINECWSHGTATLMIMGSVCTRACKFCAVDTGNPKGWLDADEPKKAAQTVSIMGLKYVVITSVDRDDLVDGGAEHFAATVRAIKNVNPDTAVEVLTPDFQGETSAVDVLVEAGIDVFAQNLETVERLTHVVRDPKAGYAQTLELLRYAKNTYPKLLTKTSLMLGFGETEEEIIQCMQAIRDHGVDILTLGQYLRPTKNHPPVERYIPPEEFNTYRDRGLEMGFLEVVAGPFVRSSYRAERVFEKNNVGL
jgi:lipoic acid synthetase